jgi:hypothetical protein
VREPQAEVAAERAAADVDVAHADRVEEAEQRILRELERVRAARLIAVAAARQVRHEHATVPGELRDERVVLLEPRREAVDEQ